MYDELIKWLRDHAKLVEEYNASGKKFCEAADAIEELQKDLERSKDFEAFWQHEAEETLKKFQVAISNKPRWIPVTERLPEESGNYLIVDDGTIMEAYYGKEWAGDNWTDPVEMYMTYHPTHWMPLPELPKDGE